VEEKKDNGQERHMKSAEETGPAAMKFYLRVIRTLGTNGDALLEYNKSLGWMVKLFHYGDRYFFQDHLLGKLTEAHEEVLLSEARRLARRFVSSIPPRPGGSSPPDDQDISEK
jgi:hypothetical protein